MTGPGTRLDHARELVAQHPVPKPLRKLARSGGDVTYYAEGMTRTADELTPQILARSLHYLIKLKCSNPVDEDSIPMGTSKYRGLPHLPPGMAWPDGCYFLAQLNLGELHRFDLFGAFPATGMFYLFFDPGGAEVEVRHYDGPTDDLRITPYPDPAGLTHAKYYLKRFLADSALVRFRPRAAFYVGSDAYDLSAVKKAVPKALRAEVAAVLGAPVTSWDCDRRIFGRPLYWQGEDEESGGRSQAGEPPHLLYQDEFGEGHIHVFIDAADARRRDYGRCWMDYSGT